jgi:Lsr2
LVSKCRARGYASIHSAGALFADWTFFLLYRSDKRLIRGVLMAQRTVIRLVDDLDDTPIVDGDGETVHFALDGRRYEIDLTSDHADEMRAALHRYVGAARKVSSRQSRARATGAKAAAAIDYSAQAVRAWAKANKIDVSPRGRISQSVVDQFRAAGN